MKKQGEPLRLAVHFPDHALGEWPQPEQMLTQPLRRRDDGIGLTAENLGATLLTLGGVDTGGLVPVNALLA